MKRSLFKTPMDPMQSLYLDHGRLIDIARCFCDKTGEGMLENNRDIKCLPAYIPVRRSVSGKALVLDVGGTRMRAAVVSVDGRNFRVEKGPLEETLPLKRGEPLARQVFLNAQADLIANLDPGPGLPLGYCFSYPSESEPGGDARLIQWTKGVNVPGMEGEPVGRVLMDALNEKGITCSRCVVLNDTTASLLAGVAISDADAHIGLVVGTGTNMATLVRASSMPKLNRSVFSHDRIPVNLESGNFYPPHLTVWDGQVDRDSDNFGKQRFEKAVSGAYLARLMQAAMPHETIDVDKGAALLSPWAYSNPPADAEKEHLAKAILDRSARLVAASLSGLLLFLNRERPIRSVTIVAEGGLIHHSPGYENTVRDVLSQLIQRLGLPTDRRDLIRIPHANLSGSAWAALSG